MSESDSSFVLGESRVSANINTGSSSNIFVVADVLEGGEELEAGAVVGVLVFVVVVGDLKALPKSGFTGNPPAVEEGAGVLEKALNGLEFEPKADPPPGDSVLLDESKAPLPEVVFLEEAEESAAKPPADEAVLDPKVVPVNPNVLAGFPGGGRGVVVGVATPPPSDEIVPKADVPPSDEVVPKAEVRPNDEVVPKADEVVSSVFFPNAANGEVLLVEGLPNVSPPEVPDPKAEVSEPKADGGLEPDPNADVPVTPKEKADLVGVAFTFAPGAFDENADDDPLEPPPNEKPELVVGGTDGASSVVISAAALLSSTTTHELFSGVWHWGGDELLGVSVAVDVAISNGSLGKFAIDPKAGAEK